LIDGRQVDPTAACRLENAIGTVRPEGFSSHSLDVLELWFSVLFSLVLNNIPVSPSPFIPGKDVLLPDP
jgi:hypothetical protein